MEFSIEETGGQILKSSNGKTVIRAPVKMKRNGKVGLRIFS